MLQDTPSNMHLGQSVVHCPRHMSCNQRHESVIALVLWMCLKIDQEERGLCPIVECSWQCGCSGAWHMPLMHHDHTWPFVAGIQ